MSAESKNAWLERFSREIGIKSSVILSGNVNDVYSDESGRYENLVDILMKILKRKGFNKLVLWDRACGIDAQRSDFIDVAQEEEMESGGEDYDLGDEKETAPVSSSPRYNDPAEFFPYLLDRIRNKERTDKYAFILDYSDYVFGNANALSESERLHLINLGKSVRFAQSYNVLSRNFAEIGDIVVLVAKNSALIPPAFYQGNFLVSSINIPFPSRTEREVFVEDNKACFNVSENLDNKTERVDFVDALDGFSIKEIIQLMKLSRQNEGDSLTCEKLINLYKYGEKVSPWEELSSEKLQDIKKRLCKRVKGQDEAVDKVEEVIVRAYTGFSGLQHSSKQKKPKGTLFFVGPTGVGKTELAKALAEFVFGDESACIRFDMSEYNHEQSDQRLVGAPPGYVGYEAGGQLTNAVKEKPFSVILFDEIEKAHGRILDKFLQILEDGRLTDGKGDTVSFAETIIIFTSNIGAADIVCSEGEARRVREQFIAAVRKHFNEELKRPELLNRIGDNIVSFNFISQPEIFIEIARMKFSVIKEFVKEKYKASLEFENEEAAFRFVAEQVDKTHGGRGLLNSIETMIVNPLAKWIFERMNQIEGRSIVISLTKPIFEFDFL